MHMTLSTGDILSFFDMVTATGATISTVATLSINADMIPENNESETIAHFTLGTQFIILSARREGIFDSIKNPTTPIVPAIIIITFQSIAAATLFRGKIPKATNKTAEAKAIYALILGNDKSKI